MPIRRGMGMMLAVLSTACIAQTPQFDVASVKPAGRDAVERSLTHRGGAGLSASNATLKMLILLAYQVMPYQISGGPAWLESEGFDIDAKSPDPKASPAQFRQMIQSLLADRFQLRVRRETKTLPVYELVVARSGTKLAEAAGDDPEVTMRIEGACQMTAVKATMSMFATALSRPLQQKVIDQTGLAGAYTFKLQFAPEQNPSKPAGDGTIPNDDRPPLFLALPRQLGLELRTGKAPVEVLVIDHAERPTAN